MSYWKNSGVYTKYRSGEVKPIDNAFYPFTEVQDVIKNATDVINYFSSDGVVSVINFTRL